MEERVTPLSITDRTSARGVAVNQSDICVIKGLLPLCVINYICFLMTHTSPNPPPLLWILCESSSRTPWQDDYEDADADDDDDGRTIFIRR